MSTVASQQPLQGVSVLEYGGGVAGAYCGKLFADMGASVWRIDPLAGDPLDDQCLAPGCEPTKGLYGAYLNAGKHPLGEQPPRRRFDLTIIGESANTKAQAVNPRVATLDISWFGNHGPYQSWQGSDLIAQALAGLVHPVGPAEGPPTFPGIHQATTLGGLAAYCAGVAALIGNAAAGQRYEISIFEAILILAELQICHSEMLGKSVPRLGVNRFMPTCPLSIHRCKQGWIGITPLTPTQWRSFCHLLDLPVFADDPTLLKPIDRHARIDELEAAFDARFPSRTADEWGALGREHKIPMVIVPNAQGILEHPIFNARGSFASLPSGGRTFSVPLTPMRLVDTPPRDELGSSNADDGEARERDALGAGGDIMAPLAGVRLVDFSMGWAGPLATRMLADWGAEVIKVEAGRYPDWWRGVDWSTEAIAGNQFERSRHFSALNRGKLSVSLDLTSAEGKALAKTLVMDADIAVENQAAGVMSRLGLGYEALSDGNERLVMMSMSAFGAGNAWSDTRAYGSVLEQGSGLPSFVGQPDGPPNMAHMAYGDPVGGIYGAASLLTALYRQRCTGRGQWINNTQIEAMLPFTTPALLIRQVTNSEPQRLGNRHPVYVPHGCFPASGDDRWVAIAVDDGCWPAFARVLGQQAWIDDARLATASGRRDIEDAIETVIAHWTRNRRPEDITAQLQRAGVAAAPVAHLDEVTGNEQLQSLAFFHAIDRPFVGQQLQTGLPVRFADGRRYPMRGLAPFLGGDSAAVLARYANVDPTGFETLLDKGIVSLRPTQLRAS